MLHFLPSAVSSLERMRCKLWTKIPFCFVLRAPPFFMVLGTFYPLYPGFSIFLWVLTPPFSVCFPSIWVYTFADCPVYLSWLPGFTAVGCLCLTFTDCLGLSLMVFAPMFLYVLTVYLWIYSSFTVIADSDFSYIIFETLIVFCHFGPQIVFCHFGPHLV